MFAVQAVVTTMDVFAGNEHWRTEQLPTFYVNGDVQGFFTEAGAAEIARRILDPFGQYAPGDLIITATEI